MNTISEIDIMKEIDKILCRIKDPATRDRILQWAWSKFSSRPIILNSVKKSKENKGKKAKGEKKTKRKISYSILKDVNLKPKDKQTFEDFVAEKNPQAMIDKCMVSIYYLIRILQASQITTNHVYTCFRISKWRVPSNLENRLQWVASQRGWLDTNDMTNIKLTTHGENYVEHDLPYRKEKK